MVLFDEIEKAHPDIFNILLQILEDGRLTDSQGRTVNFKNTIIIMTSNVGARQIVEPKKLGFAAQQENTELSYKEMKNRVMDEVKKLFRPEFLNRVDDIIVFHPLNNDEIKQIAKLMMKGLHERMEGNGVEVEFTDNVYNLIPRKVLILPLVQDP